jgi:hypothetical protein
MTPLEVLNQFRSEVQDEALPYLWTDTEIYRYMVDAQEMFCRLGGGIADSTSSVTTLTATAGEPFTDLSSRILKIRHASRASDNKQIEILNFEDMARPTLSADYNSQTEFRMDDEEGEIIALIEGLEQSKVRWYKVPETTQTVNLVVYRMPTATTLTGAGTLEIHEQHHLNLIHWIKHRAYLKQDAEAFDRTKAEEFRQQFISYCDRSKRDREQREHKYRTVAYGGI